MGQLHPYELSLTMIWSLLKRSFGCTLDANTNSSDVNSLCVTQPSYLLKTRGSSLQTQVISKAGFERHLLPKNQQTFLPTHILHHWPLLLLLLLARSHLVLLHPGLGQALLKLADVATLRHTGLKILQPNETKSTNRIVKIKNFIREKKFQTTDVEQIKRSHFAPRHNRNSNFF